MGSARLPFGRLLLIGILPLLITSCLNEPEGADINVESAAQLNEPSDESINEASSESPSSSTGEVEVQDETNLDPSQSEDAALASDLPTVSPEETPAIIPLQLVNQGYNQTDRQIAYAFVVENQNQDAAVADSKYEVTAYDSTGVNLASDSEFLAMLLPNEQLGIAGNLFLEQSTPVSLITVRLETGQPQYEFSDSGLDVKNIRHLPGQRYDRITAIISNNGPNDLSEIRLAAIAYDSQGSIIGAGHSLLNFLLADRETGVDITLGVASEIDRIELFPRLSPASILPPVDQIRNSSNRLSLLDSGFSQQDIELSYGFLFINRNLSFAIEDSLYRLTAYDDAGYVIAVDEGRIDLIFPGQTLGLGKSLFIENEEAVDKIDLSIQNGTAKLTSALPLFEVQDIELGQAGDFNDLTGQLLNPFDKILENINVHVIFFDQAGLIIGGSSERLDNLPAASSASVELHVPAPVTPVTAQLFASVGDLDDLE